MFTDINNMSNDMVNDCLRYILDNGTKEDTNWNASKACFNIKKYLPEDNYNAILKALDGPLLGKDNTKELTEIIEKSLLK